MQVLDASDTHGLCFEVLGDLSLSTEHWRGWRSADVFVWKPVTPHKHSRTNCKNAHCGLDCHILLTLTILSRFFFTFNLQSLAYTDEEESEIPSSHINFLFITSINAGRGEEDNLSSSTENISDKQAVRISDYYIDLRTIHQVYSTCWFFLDVLCFTMLHISPSFPWQSTVSTDDEDSAISSSHLNFLFVTSFHAEAAADQPVRGH